MEPINKKNELQKYLSVKLYPQYNFLGLTNEEFLTIATQELNQNPPTSYQSTEEEIYLAQAELALQTFFDTIVQKQLTNPNTALSLTSNYIDLNTKSLNSYPEAITTLNKLSTLWKKYNFLPEPSFLIELINKNPKLNQSLKLVVKKEDNHNLDANLKILIDTYRLEDKAQPFPQEDYLSSTNINTYEETDLFTSYLNDLPQRPLLTKEEERNLVMRIQKGEQEAKNTLIENNLRLVIYLSKKYVNQGLPLLDLIQEGNIGLIKAIDTYDINKNYRFATYAFYSIQTSILDALYTQGRMIRLPNEIRRNLIMLEKAQTQLYSKLRREPTIGELAFQTDFSSSKVKKLLKLKDDCLSLDSSAFPAEDKELCLHEIIADPNSFFEDDLVFKDMQKQVRNFLDNSILTDRERAILKMRNGFYNNTIISLESIGTLYGISRERVRQIEATAYQKIRRSPGISDLQVYKNNPIQPKKKVKSRKDTQ